MTKVARIITDVFQPRNIILVGLVAVGARHGFVGVGWAILGAACAAVIPAWVLNRGVREGAFDDRHIERRQNRTVIFTLMITLMIVCLAVMFWLHAPTAVTASVTGLAVTTVGLALINHWWKISVHTAAAGCLAAALSATYGSWFLALYTMVVAIGWSRVALRSHTAGQVAAGAALGTAAASAAFLVW
ncbi:hypothetical protein [Streptomyces sp. NPDC085665]|uniref:hypothetical protein n=1 Tax=Streptomyces sp. NPDC085665 TaxID=3365735 RepID=UPI0037CD6EB0